MIESPQLKLEKKTPDPMKGFSIIEKKFKSAALPQMTITFQILSFK
jgi:hypothetical protein